MGLFDRAKKAMNDATGAPGAGMAGGDWAAQAQAAQQLAAEELRKAGYGTGMPTMADVNAGLGAQMAADRDVLQAYGQELNRVYQIGEVGTGVITAAIDTGERTAGQAWFQIEASLSLPGREPYTASKREMVPDMALEKYVAGSSHEVRVDPADPQNFVFAS